MLTSSMVLRETAPVANKPILQPTVSTTVILLASIGPASPSSQSPTPFQSRERSSSLACGSPPGHAPPPPTSALNANSLDVITLKRSGPAVLGCMRTTAPSAIETISPKRYAQLIWLSKTTASPVLGV